MAGAFTSLFDRHTPPPHIFSDPFRLAPHPLPHFLSDHLALTSSDHPHLAGATKLQDHSACVLTAIPQSLSGRKAAARKLIQPDWTYSLAAWPPPAHPSPAQFSLDPPGPTQPGPVQPSTERERERVIGARWIRWNTNTNRNKVNPME